MAGTCARIKHLGINSDSIVANSKAQLPSGIPNLDLDLFRMRMAKRISKSLLADPEEFVLKKGHQGRRRAFHGDMECCVVFASGEERPNIVSPPL